MMCIGIFKSPAGFAPQTGRLRFRLPLWAACLFLVFIVCACDQVVSDEARRRFQNRTGSITLTVFPVQVITGSRVTHDQELAGRVSDFINAAYPADSRTAATPIQKPAFYGVAETRRIRLSARYLSQAIQGMDLNTGYAFMAEIVCNPDETRVLGVYWFLADRFGRIAGARMANAHHREFQRINPKNRNEALPVLIEMIREGWMEANQR